MHINYFKIFKNLFIDVVFYIFSFTKTKINPIVYFSRCQYNYSKHVNHQIKIINILLFYY